MANQKIEPHKINKPIQLTAVWFAALVIICGSFLTAASQISEPSWLSPVLAIAAILFVFVFLIGVFLMQTKFRPELQDDSHYSEYLKWKNKIFDKFSPENLGGNSNENDNSSTNGSLEQTRLETYKNQKGLFIIHSWRPSEIEGQKADIVIWLHQHGKGPLTEKKVEKVEYVLGPKFFKKPKVKKNKKDFFKIEVSAYGPMLCVANVYLKGEKEPIELKRYIDFEDYE